MCGTVSFQTGAYAHNYSAPCIMQEARLKFWSEFDYYQNDDQYLKFLFVSLKNKMSNLRSKEVNMKSKFAAPLLKSEDSSNDDAYMNGLNQIKDETTDEQSKTFCEKLMPQFSIDDVLAQLDDNVDKMIVTCIVSGKNVIQTSRELKLPKLDVTKRLETNILEVVNDARAEHVVKEKVLQIPEEFLCARK